jgi:ribonuclease Z
MGRVNGMQIDGDKLTKVFLGHLHLDHVGDLDILWAQGGFSGRTVPIEVYGPSGPNHELGTKVFVEHMLASGQWDLESRKTGIPTAGMAINTHEFDFTKTQIVYEENDVTITSFPAIHAIDGAVSYRLDWNGLSMVFSSDTEPNKFLVENSQNVDVLIHEGFIPAQTMTDIMGTPLEISTFISEKAHTPPDAAGVVFHMTQPKLAVLYHVILTQEVITESFELLRTTYAGPSLYAEDLVTINVTPDYIISRPTEIVKNAYPTYKAAEGEVEGSEFGKSDWLVEALIDWKSIKEDMLKENQ